MLTKVYRKTGGEKQKTFKFSTITNIVVTLPCFVSILFFQRDRIKREPGENPGQSRCCKSNKMFIHSLPLPL